MMIRELLHSDRRDYMNKIKEIINNFISLDASIKVSIIVFVLAVILGIVFVFSWAIDYYKNKTDKEVNNVNTVSVNGNNASKANSTGNNVSSSNITGNNASSSNIVVNNVSSSDSSGNIASQSISGGTTQQNAESYSSITANNNLRNNLPQLILFTIQPLGSEEVTVCKEMEPKINQIKRDYETKLLVLNMSQTSNPFEIEKYNIQLYPTSIILNSNGVEVKRIEGAWDMDEMVSTLASLGIQ